MNLFSFTKEQQGKSERRQVDLDSVVYAEEFHFTPPEGEEGEPVRYVVLHLNVTHDMQLVKKQAASGKPQEFTYARVPMTIRISGDENVERLFKALGYGQ